MDFPEQFTLPKGASTLPRTLYCTMPTLESYQQILSLWNAYQKRAKRPDRAAPWWSMFDLLLELRPWGSEDRLVEDARRVITDRLPLDDDQEVPVEFEIWPAVSGSRRSAWRTETESRIIARGGQILDRSSISQPGFIYEAILAGLPAGAVRHMLDSPEDLDGLVTIQGVQFILPWTTGQTDRAIPEPRGTVSRLTSGFSVDAPIRAVLLDGTPVAAHPALVGGVAIEDIHDLVRLSEVRHRTHATSMASLILRGDLEVDGTGLQDTRLLCVPLLVDVKDGAWGPKQRLFVNMVHTALSRLVRSDSPTAPDLFVCNLSVGIKDLRFAGRVSALARLLDWFAAKEGVLFVVSSGNVTDLPPIGKYAQAIESADGDDRRLAVHSYMSDSAYGRTLLSPAEALNALTVGALSTNSKDLQVPRRTGIVTLERGTESLPQITSAVGLGPQRAVKPDILNLGGQQELSFVPAGGDIVARPLEESQRTGILGAAPAPDGAGDGRARHRGTSVAAALTTRAVLQAAEALTRDDGPYAGQELPRRHLALMTRALAVNSARWPEEALDVLEFQLARFGNNQHSRAKAEVCRFFGYGAINPDLMVQAPDHGATLVGFGTVGKNQARVFRMPLPASLAGEKVGRSMRVTVAWFTPVNPARAQYRLAALEATADDGSATADSGWGLSLKPDGPDANLIKRGSLWSRRLTSRTRVVPDYGSEADIAVRIQCRDASNGGLSSDEEIDFAIAVTLEVEASLQYDIYDEIKAGIAVRLRRGE